MFIITVTKGFPASLTFSLIKSISLTNLESLQSNRFPSNSVTIMLATAALIILLPSKGFPIRGTKEYITLWQKM